MPENAAAAQIALNESQIDSSDLSAFAADQEMIAEFVTESREHLDAVEQRLLLIEKDSADLDSVNAVFRAIHTIKGLAGFLELKAIQNIAHEIETLLDHARSSRLVLTPARVDVLFEGTDYLSREVDRVKRQVAGDNVGSPAANAELLLSLRAVAEESPSHEPVRPVQAAEGDPRATVLNADVPAPSGVQSFGLADKGKDVSEASAAHVDDATVRVETAKLDRLMDAVGELVIAQTLVSHNPEVTRIEDPRLTGDLAMLHRITQEVQRITTSIRMVPIGYQFQKTARLVRDLSRQMGKPITLSTSGEETELDKTIAEELSGPLLHMVRNSVDHGIEDPQERLLVGKDANAQIKLAAYHESSEIVIEITDDGRGLNRERILAKAVERGLLKPGAQLTDSETFQLIFEPGFSTAEKLTGISGRGVGMDVVQRHVQQLRGRIEIISRAGVGTTFLLKLPLTLALIEGLVVLVGDRRFVLPLSSVTEIFCASESQIVSGLSGEDLVTLRGSDLPVVRLHERFNIAARSGTLTDGVFILTQAQDRPFCIFVDEMLGKQDIVIKNLGSLLKNAPGFMGCAILSDGLVGLILDVDGIMP